VTEALKVVVHADHVRVEVHVVPRASRSAILGVHDGRLKVSLDAPPVDGEANAALIAFLAKALKRPKRDIVLVRGDTSRHKTLALHGVSEQEVRALLARG
jgi:uncharacterized protein (TIGR00251 family)